MHHVTSGMATWHIRCMGNYHSSEHIYLARYVIRAQVQPFSCAWLPAGCTVQLMSSRQSIRDTQSHASALLHADEHASRIWPSCPSAAAFAVSPVGPESMAAWRGFVHMIVIGYYEKRWAWYPIDRLQMELAATNGRTEKPALVAEFAGVVYATLERVAPQFPSR